MHTDKESCARRRRFIVAFSATSFLCFSITTVYFHEFPILVNPTVSDSFIATILITWTIVVLASCLIARRQSEVGLVLVNISMFAFVVRSIPILRLGVPFLHDPYFFMTSAQDLLGSGTLSPNPSALYPQVGDVLLWPLMQL